MDPPAGNKNTGVNSEETEKRSEQGSDPPPTNGNRVYQMWESGKKFFGNMLSGNKNVDKSQKNTDKQGNKNQKNNKAIEEDPTVSRVCGQSQKTLTNKKTKI